MIFSYRLQTLSKKGFVLKSIGNLTDRELILAAREIEAEAKLRANRKAAASAILAILRKNKLSVSDLKDLNLGQDSAKRGKIKTKTKEKHRVKTESVATKKKDRRAKVAFKYKNPKGSEKWSGRGRAPKWVSDILVKKRISLAQFKSNKRYKV